MTDEMRQAADSIRCQGLRTDLRTPAAQTLLYIENMAGGVSDGQPLHLPSSRSAGTRIDWTGPAGEEWFELTEAVLTDGTYAAERAE
ncbi:hypothetical protein ACFWAR_00755 [Streptomyces sp. NPDC059917]|uniref:hypothetical protein n=1 Tax=Streptomyces sp. NPDC059917 TaxID=3347002 RepID=UPI0036636148